MIVTRKLSTAFNLPLRYCQSLVGPTRHNAQAFQYSYSTSLPATTQLYSIDETTSAESTMALPTKTNLSSMYTLFEAVMVDLRDGLLWAVPKNKRSLSKRRWLRRFRAIKPRKDIEDCVVCGSKKLIAHVCTECFRENSWTVGKLGEYKTLGEIRSKKKQRTLRTKTDTGEEAVSANSNTTSGLSGKVKAIGASAKEYAQTLWR